MRANMNYKNIEQVSCLKTEKEFQLLRAIHRETMESNVIEAMKEWNDDIQLSRLKKHYEQHGDTLRFLILDNKIIGTINFHLKEFKENNQIKILPFVEQFYILKNYQRCGIGKYLLEQLNTNEEVRLSVLKTDMKAVGFYQKNGYQIYHQDEYQFYMKKLNENIFTLSKKNKFEI